MLADKSVRDLLAAFASSDPTPGGGSASAVASAVGVSLLMMVASLKKTRSGSDEDRAALVAAAASLGDLQQQLAEAIDADRAAYDQVVAAYKSKATEADQAARNAAIQRALRAAAAVPLTVMRWSALALRQAEAVAAHGHRAAASDAGVAVALLRAGFDGARLNVLANLRQLTDAAHKDDVTAEVARLARDVQASIAAAERLLGAG